MYHPWASAWKPLSGSAAAGRGSCRWRGQRPLVARAALESQLGRLWGSPPAYATSNHGLPRLIEEGLASA